MKRVLITLGFFLVASVAFGQGNRIDGIAWNQAGRPQPGATVAVCTQPATTNIQPCSPLATLYTNSSLAVACTGSNGCSNPLTADGLGNYHFYADPRSAYTVQFYGSGITPSFLMDQSIGTTLQTRFVSSFATSGTGTVGLPWMGWEGALTSVPCGSTVHFNAGYYSTASTFIFPNTCSANQISIEGEGLNNTYVTFTGSSTPALEWVGAANGGGLRNIQIITNNAAVDAVLILSVNNFRMHSVILQGPYAGSGNAVGCFADNGAGCGLHIIGGSTEGDYYNVKAIEFNGDGINIDAESTNANTFRTVWGQGSGGWGWDIHRADNAASGGPIYCYDCEGVAVPSFPTAGGFNITSGVALTLQHFGLWCFECVADGATLPSTAVGMNLSLVSFVFISNSWIKSLSSGGTALQAIGVQNFLMEGGFIQNASTTIAPIVMQSGTSTFRINGALITAMGAQPIVHWGGGSAGASNSLQGSAFLPGSVALTDDFTNAGFTGGGSQDPTAFSKLPSGAVNGMILFCTDCKNVVDNAATAGAACLGTGSGAMAKRENGRWDCN